MKDTELKKLLDGKDLSKDETLAEITTALNNEFNSLIAKKENSYNEKIDALKKENESLKGETAKIAELNKTIETEKAQNKSLTQRAYIYKNVGAVADEDLEDLITLTNSRLSKDANLKFEDAVKQVAEKRGFVAKKVDEKPIDKPAGSIPPSPTAKTNNGSNKESESTKDDFMSWLKGK